jgi:hypothetical protein
MKAWGPFFKRSKVFSEWLRRQGIGVGKALTFDKHAPVRTVVQGTIFTNLKQYVLLFI